MMLELIVLLLGIVCVWGSFSVTVITNNADYFLWGFPISVVLLIVATILGRIRNANNT